MVRPISGIVIWLNQNIYKLFYYLFHKPIVVARVAWDYFAPIMPDELFTKVKFRLEMDIGWILKILGHTTKNFNG